MGLVFSQTQLIDWTGFLERNDPVYDTLTSQWEAGLFTGNGLLGTMIYMKDAQTLRIDIGRSDVVDHRVGIGSALYNKARLPIGYFTLRFNGKLRNNHARIDLWNACAKGTILTDKGRIQWESETLSQTDIILLRIKASGSEQGQVDFVPGVSRSERSLFSYVTDVPAGYQANPLPRRQQEGGLTCWRQAMLAGGEYVTAWTSKKDNGWKQYYITVAYETTGAALNKARENLQHATQTHTDSLLARHRRWWHHYYPQSFLSLPDRRTESFYWIQQYKMASATREGRPPMDLMGPWYHKTPWPAYWMNLNMQLSYSPLYAANRLQLARGLVNMLNAGKANLKRNVPEAYRHNALALGRFTGRDLYHPVRVFRDRDPMAAAADLELGNLTWCLYYYWLQYRYSMEDSIRQSLIPLLRGSINYYLDIIYKEADGHWHLPPTYSPEYPDGITRDCNYDLSLLRWGCRTLLELSPADSLAPVWKDVLENLTPYPQDENGLRIGRDIGLSQSHRHYSHLLMIYPLHLMTWDQPENRPLIQKSLEHWHSFTGALQGYSFTGGAAIYALMGRGNQALDYLNQLFDRYVKPHTMYMESGPVIETPLAAAATIQTLLLQSDAGIVKVFGAVPESWQNLSFSQLRAQGAFLISAVRAQGRTRWLRIESPKGGALLLQASLQGVLHQKGSQVAIEQWKKGTYRIRMKPGDRVTLYTDPADLKVQLQPVDQPKSGPQWGSKR
ncbi:hypothetical protein GCM10027051_17110 [Niabella terrae]